MQLGKRPGLSDGHGALSMCARQGSIFAGIPRFTEGRRRRLAGECVSAIELHGVEPPGFFEYMY